MNQQVKDYEVILLGSGLGGLIAGALLASRGRSVLLLQEEGYQTSYIRDGYRFTPFSNFSERHLRPALLQKIFDELSLPATGSDWGRDLSVPGEDRETGEKVPFQIILPEARIDLFDSPSLLQREREREFPDESVPIEAFYKEMEEVQVLLAIQRGKEASPLFPLDSRSLIQRWLSIPFQSRKRTDERLSSFSEGFKEFIRLQFISWGNLSSAALPIPLLAYVLLHEERGEWVSHMDIDGLRGKIRDRYLQSGGEIEEIDRVEGVQKIWRKGFTLNLGGDRRRFRTRSLVLNSPLHFYLDVFGRRDKTLLKWLSKIRPRYILFAHFLGIHEKVVPVGMRGDLVSVLNLGKDDGEGNLLFLGLSPEGSKTETPEGRRALTVLSLIPFRDWASSSYSLTSHHNSVLEHLNYLIPYLGEYLEFADFDWATQQMKRWSYPHFIYETPFPFYWRRGIIPTRLSRGLYFIGKENLPYLGLEGEVLAGLMVVRQILKDFH